MTLVTVPEFPEKPPTSFERKTHFRNSDPWQTDLQIPNSVWIGRGFWNSSSSSSCYGSLENLMSGLLVLPTSTAPWINSIESGMDRLRAEKRAVFVRVESASENLFELRRLTGFSWIRLANLLNVDRRTLNNWVRGGRIRERNCRHIARTLEVMRFADRGSSERNSVALYERHTQYQISPFEAIRAGNYERARQLLSHGPSRSDGWQAGAGSMSWTGEFQPIVMHADADGTETIKPLPDEPEPVSRKRPIRRG